MIFAISVIALITPILTSKCGIATNQFFDCADCLLTAADCGMKFWWNWDVAPTDYLISGITIKGAEFIPMIWGPTNQGITNASEIPSLLKATYLMGFNEPDHYGPPCWNKQDVGGWVYEGCDGHSYSSAASSGTWLPAFNPTKGYAAQAWATTINQLLATGLKMPKIVSPSMAGPAKGGDALQKCLLVTNASVAAQGEKIISDIGNCDGWLTEFKKATLAMHCGSTNCWDIIDHIQIHCYAYKASDCTNKIEEYIEVFKEDFQGLNGRTKKYLWLTEVAGGSDKLAFQISFMQELVTYLESKAEIFHYSWFSEWAFNSFKMNDITPEAPSWRSSLFNPFGDLSPLGKEYFKLCNGGTLPSGCNAN